LNCFHYESPVAADGKQAADATTRLYAQAPNISLEGSQRCRSYRDYSCSYGTANAGAHDVGFDGVQHIVRGQCTTRICRITASNTMAQMTGWPKGLLSAVSERPHEFAYTDYCRGHQCPPSPAPVP